MGNYCPALNIPIMENKIHDDPIEVYAGNGWQAGMVKSLLDNAEIEAFMKDEIMGVLSPWWTDAGGAGYVKVFVSKNDFDRAMIVVNDFEKNINEEYPDKQSPKDEKPD